VAFLAALLVVGASDEQRTVVRLLDDDRIGERKRQGALRALDGDQTVGDVDVDPAGNRDRKSSDSGHEFVSSCYQT